MKETGDNFCDLGLGEDLLDTTPKISIQEQIDKFDIIIKIVLQKTLVRECKDKPQSGRKSL